MQSVDSFNPRIPKFLHIVTLVECLVVFAAAAFLFFSPVMAKAFWAWSVPPFNSRYIGAIYFAALFPLVVMAISGRWSPGRVVLWMIFTFTTSIGVVMLLHASSFDWTRWSTYAFWALYIFLPINSAFQLYRFRRVDIPAMQPNPPAWQDALTVVSTLLAAYGLGLLLIPAVTTSFWPWLIDAFHGRIYAATFLTPAVGAWLIRRKGSPAEAVVLGLTLICYGLFSIAGVLWTSTTVPLDKQINFGVPGTWVFLGMNLLAALVGAGILLAGQRKSAR